MERYGIVLESYNNIKHLFYSLQTVSLLVEILYVCFKMLQGL